QDLPCAIDVIHAPPAEERAVRFLMFADELDGALDLRVVQGNAFEAHDLEDPCGDIDALRIEHGVVIGEGDLFEDAVRAVLVESGPAAVPALEGEHPCVASAEGGVATLRVSRWHLAKGQQDHGGVIDIRVPLVVVLEDPAGRFNVSWVLVVPVAAETNLAVNEPRN